MIWLHEFSNGITLMCMVKKWPKMTQFSANSVANIWYDLPSPFISTILDFLSANSFVNNIQSNVFSGHCIDVNFWQIVDFAQGEMSLTIIKMNSFYSRSSIESSYLQTRKKVLTRIPKFKKDKRSKHFLRIDFWGFIWNLSKTDYRKYLKSLV